MRSDLPSGTVTFLFTDVEGSTKLLEEVGEEAYAELLAEHHRLCREAWEAHAGVEVDTEGDAFFVVFERASDAIAAAQAAQAALAPGPVRVRMGLHTGEVLLTETGYVGRELHRAARIASSAHGGQIVLSRQTSELAGAGFPLSALGEHRFKDFEAPLAIYQLGEGSFPPLKTISNTNLPRPASSFVGRKEELAEVLGRIEAGARLVTLTGPGGTGKTRLALEAAMTLVPAYKAGVFWVGLAALRDPALVTETISQTLGAKDGLAQHIGERGLMLLLDNLEQVVEAAPELSALVTACPNLTLLVTSRELLRVQGEVEYPVPPLAQPEAVSLFCERAQLEPTDEIAELCVRLDSLPLAVELAAARTKALSPAQILERLSLCLDLLKGGRDADPRQQTLRATIEWSYDLLSGEEQQLFARLAVFAGGCTLKAAEEVCEADLDTLQSLVEKSLLRFTNERYWMLETIREYAAEALRNAADAKQLATRHALYYTEVTERASERALDDPQAGYGELDREHDNVRQALQALSVEVGSDEELRLVRAIGRFWLTRGHYREGRDRIGAALQRNQERSVLRIEVLALASDLARLAGDRALATAYAEESVAAARQHGEPGLLARAMHELGESVQAEGDLARAEVLYQQAVAIARQAGKTGVGSVANLGDLALVRGDFHAAVAFSREAVELSRAEHGTVGQLVPKFNLASALIQLGETTEARNVLAEVLAGFAQGGYTEGIAWCLLAVAALMAQDSRPEDAARLVSAADGMLEEIDARLAPAERRLRDAAMGRTEGRIAEGEHLTPEAAVAFALRYLD